MPVHPHFLYRVTHTIQIDLEIIGVVYLAQYRIAITDLLVDGVYGLGDLVTRIYAIVGVSFVAFDTNALKLENLTSLARSIVLDRKSTRLNSSH